MKLTSFNCTIELSKDENGYSNNYYVDITEQGVIISHPYIKQSHEQAQLVNELINQFIDDFNHITRRIDGFNRDMKLEEYAPQVPSTEETVSESTDVSAVPQSCALGDGEVSTGADGETKTLAQQVEDNVIESLGLK